VGGDPNKPDWKVDALGLADDLTLARLQSRRELLKSIDNQRAQLDEAASLAAMSSYKQQAMELLGSTAARQAFDLAQETDAMRDRYGRNIHGQCVLLARRLIEHGVPLVTVNWHNDGANFWDTHGDNFNRLKKDLIPPADQALSALITDLEERGLLDETIIAWVGEFGRRPRITDANAGREHWPRCYSGLLAGAGIRGGAIHGASDAHASRPTLHPTTPQDYIATLYHALGIDTTMMLLDAFGRPHHFCDGKPLATLFS
jgi:uncharacterized protein (DUF1501 family)